MKEAFEKIVERLEEERHPEIYGGWETMRIDKAIGIVNQVAEEYSHRNHDLVIEVSHSNDGWIPCSKRLPEEKENPVTRDWYVYPVMVQFEEITDIRYYSFGNGHWHHGPSIMDKYVTRWMDIKPYQPKGDQE